MGEGDEPHELRGNPRARLKRARSLVLCQMLGARVLLGVFAKRSSEHTGDHRFKRNLEIGQQEFASIVVRNARPIAACK